MYYNCYCNCREFQWSEGTWHQRQ